MLRPSWRFTLQLLFVEMIVAIVSSLVLTYIREADFSRNDIYIVVLIHFFVFFLVDKIENFFTRGYLNLYEKVVQYTVVYGLLLTFSSFMLESAFVISRRGVIYFLLINHFLVYSVDCIFKRFYKDLSLLRYDNKKTFLVTSEDRLLPLFQHLSSQGLQEHNIVGAILVGSNVNFTIENIKIIPEYDSIDFARKEVVDRVIIDLPSSTTSIEHWVSEFETMGIDVHLNLHLEDFDVLGKKRVETFAGLNVLSFSTGFYKWTHVFSKRLLDVIGSIVGLILCGLVAIFLAPFILSDGGPLFFSQLRVGKNGRIFTFYKFRSMRVDAEVQKKELLQYNQMEGGMFKMDNDPRITKIGNFIRKTSLDELPQFYNVLIGEMSLVGTRPPTLDEFEKYTPYQKRRLSFKPGITGLWQVSGRSNITDFDQIVKLDLQYIDNWTIWSDIRIILKTIKVVLSKEGSK